MLLAADMPEKFGLVADCENDAACSRMLGRSSRRECWRPGIWLSTCARDPKGPAAPLRRGLPVRIRGNALFSKGPRRNGRRPGRREAGALSLSRAGGSRRA